MIIRKSLSKFLLSTLLIIILPATSHATEGGSSGYLQGTYGEFTSGMVGDAGFYMRNDLFYYSASIGANPVGGAISTGSTQDIWGNLVKFAYASDYTILGGRFNAALAIPLVLKGSVTANATGLGKHTFKDGDVNGIGDIYITPFALVWDIENHHINANLSFVTPTGGYDVENLLNPGRNYWSFDPTVYYTWLHPKRGHEVSISLGYMMNAENSDTQYTSGDEMHLDWTFAQHFSESFAIGLTGYWYEQITNDKGSISLGIDVNRFKGKGIGLGPTVHYAHKIGSTNVSFIGKWIKDIESENRMDGDIFILSAAFKF